MQACSGRIGWMNAREKKKDLNYLFVMFTGWSIKGKGRKRRGKRERDMTAAACAEDVRRET